MAAIARSLHPFLHYVFGHILQIVGPTDSRKEIDQDRSQVELAEFGRFVVPWEYVMIIMPTFA